jgi:hypothetical protein
VLIIIQVIEVARKLEVHLNYNKAYRKVCCYKWTSCTMKCWRNFCCSMQLVGGRVGFGMCTFYFLHTSMKEM